jgi:hypothetical protein
MTTRFPARRLAGGLLLVALALAAGCKSEKQTASSVTGTVKYNGKPQTVGSVNFLSATGSGGQAALDENGGFKMDTPLDAGEYKVYLAAPVPGQLAPGTKPAAPAAKFNVSGKFLQPESSGVKVTLKPGPNDGVAIEFKD